MPAISIIVPVYNVDEYIEECVRSLTRQSFDDIEILLMEDESPDNSAEICDRLSEEDNRVKTFHLKHCGVSAARNIGVEKSSGRYIMFVDGDDWVDTDFCRIPYETAERENADLVVFGYCKEGKTLEDYSCPEYDGIIPFDSRITVVYEISSVYCWNRIYRRELFTNIKFPEGFYYEDFPVAHKLVHEAKKVCYTSGVLYHYRMRAGSITKTKTHEMANDFYDMHMVTVSDLDDWGMPEEAQRFKCRLFYYYLQMMGNEGKYSSECHHYFCEEDYRKDALTWKQRIIILLYRFYHPLFDLVSKMLGKKVDR